MPQALFEQLTSIETQAAEIVTAAEKAKILAVIHAQKQAEQLLLETEAAAKKEAATLIENAKEAARAEKAALEAENRRQIEQLNQLTAPKIEAARELCR
jgi:vacuolar-type H+-ATPase subunit H